MSRNIVAAETAEANRTNQGSPARGGYTFHAVIDPAQAGEHGLTVAAVRVGDHAHVHVLSGRIVQRGGLGDWMAEPTYGEAGWLVLRWPEWLVLRAALDVGSENVRVCEVESPTAPQARYALRGSASNRGSCADLTDLAYRAADSGLEPRGKTVLGALPAADAQGRSLLPAASASSPGTDSA